MAGCPILENYFKELSNLKNQKISIFLQKFRKKTSKPPTILAPQNPKPGKHFPPEDDNIFNIQPHRE
jgi:hypothetical protein